MKNNGLIDEVSMVSTELDYGKFLITAVENNHISLVRELLSHGVNPNSVNDTGETALKIACSHSCGEIIKFLLDAGADPSIRDDVGYTAFCDICSNNRYDIISYFLVYDCVQKEIRESCITGLFCACAKNNYFIVDILLKNGLDPNTQCSFGWTGLMVACRLGYVQTIVTLLQNKKTSVLIQNKDGDTALDIARKFECTDYWTIKMIEEKMEMERMNT